MVTTSLQEPQKESHWFKSWVQLGPHPAHCCLVRQWVSQSMDTFLSRRTIGEVFWRGEGGRFQEWDTYTALNTRESDKRTGKKPNQIERKRLAVRVVYLLFLRWRNQGPEGLSMSLLKVTCVIYWQIWKPECSFLLNWKRIQQFTSLWNEGLVLKDVHILPLFRTEFPGI